MRRSSHHADAAITFPANPFVALADLAIALVLILVLAVLHESVSSNRLIERVAVHAVERKLVAETADDNASSPGRVLARATKNGEFRQLWIDGDLQRFRIHGPLCFGPRSNILRPAAGGQVGVKSILAAFGRVLSRHEGNLRDPGSGLFKRIIVEGNADPSEGDDAARWKLSLARAQAVVAVLERDGHLSPEVIEASGRGSWDPAVVVQAGMSPQQRTAAAAANRRIELVLAYSGVRAEQFLTRLANDTTVEEGTPR